MDLTNDIARERSLGLDIDGFEKAMAGQRAKSRQASSFAVEGQIRFDLQDSTEFLGYTHLDAGAVVVALAREGNEVRCLVQVIGRRCPEPNPVLCRERWAARRLGFPRHPVHHFSVETKKYGHTSVTRAGLVRVN